MSDHGSELPELPELGPPPKSSAEWFFTRRPGRSLDAANVRLVKDGRRQPIHKRRNGVRGLLTTIIGIVTRS